MKRVVEALKQGKSLISKPETWTQGAFARHKDGHPVPEFSCNAASWCSLGALAKAACADDDTENYTFNAAATLLRRALKMGAVTDLAKFNDTHTHAEVMAMWDKAIAIAESEL